MNLHELTQITADESKAFEFIEKLRWPNGPTCPHCGAIDRIARLANQTTKPSKKHPKGKPVYGLWKCYQCRGQFTVRKGTIFEESPIPLGKWILAIHLMCSSKKGISANQIRRELGISYQSAWFLCHRVRAAMTDPGVRAKLGEDGGIVEVDETYLGGKAKNDPHRGRKPKAKPIVMTLVERDGEARTAHVRTVNRHVARRVIQAHVSDTAHIMTDSSKVYPNIGQDFAGHESINHSHEYVRGIIHTNFAESYHSLLKRGLLGTFHHVSAKHLSRYLREFEFRWNSRKATDGARTVEAIMGAEGKRLTYKPLTSH